MINSMLEIIIGGRLEIEMTDSRAAVIIQGGPWYPLTSSKQVCVAW